MTTAMLASLLFPLALVAAGGGCEVAIGNDVPAFECVAGPAVCPGSQVCDLNTHQCVAPCSVSGCSAGLQCDPGSNVCVVAEAGPVEASAGDVTTGDGDASTTSDEAAPPPDTGGPPETGSCRGLTCPCSGAAACDSGICADSSVVPTDLYNAAGHVSFCTKPCCTSADCDAGTVCYAAGGRPAAAGNYCVSPSWIGRSTVLGTAPGGSSCGTGRDCRSGLCAAGGTCADPCCSTSGAASECATGTTCRFGKFPGATAADTNFVASCGQGGNGQNGASCSGNSSCASELCDGINGCSSACRNTADCGSGESCAYVNPPAPNSSAVVAACYVGAGPGNGAQGSSCGSDGDCRSQFCDTTTTHACSDVCFADSDCTKAGWRCRPATLALGGGNFSVLACGP